MTPAELIFEQSLGLAYKYDVIEANREKAVSFLANRLSADDDVKMVASAKLNELQEINRHRNDGDFLSKTYFDLINSAMLRIT